MKNLILIALAIIFANLCVAQVPQGMSYQSVVRDTNGDLVIGSSVGLQISIIQGSPSGTTVFVETHAPLTNANGLASLEIGNGTPVTGTFESIDWASGPYFVKSEVDPVGGTNYTVSVISELLSVPYALYAGDDGDWALNANELSTDKRVGIGISDPAARLDVLGGDWNLDAGNPGDLRIGNETNNFRIGIATGGGGVGITRMYTNSNALILGSYDTPMLTIGQNQAVGIGTTNPKTPLEINSVGLSDTLLLLRNASANGPTDYGILFNDENGTGTVGASFTADSIGIYGESASGYGIRGRTTGTFGIGLYGESYGESSVGAYGASTGAAGIGVYASGETGIYTQSSAPGGTALVAISSSTSGTNYGVDAITYSTAGTGVRGRANGTSGRGIIGRAIGSYGQGVRGEATGSSGTGVYGEGYVGVSAISNSPGGTALIANSSSTEGTNYGVDANANGSNAIGIRGIADGSFATGVRGSAAGNGGIGVSGEGATGISGVSSSNSGIGLKGVVTGIDSDAVYGQSTGTNGTGVYGSSNSPTGIGIEAFNFSQSGTAFGIKSTTNSDIGIAIAGTGNIGILGNSNILYPIGQAVKGLAGGTFGQGIRGEATGESGKALYGEATGLYGKGIHVKVTSTHSSANAILAEWGGGSSYAGYFVGRVYVTDNLHVAGILSKAAGSFKIDHPLDPENKYLSHSFVESPDMMNIYNGNVTTDKQGNALVELPNYFEALNMEFRYQLTVMGQFAQAIVNTKIEGNSFEIKTDKPNVEVSWQVTGVRNDAFAQKNRIQVEEDKEAENIGKYLNPEAFGENASRVDLTIQD
jgi:hypothetical protein